MNDRQQRFIKLLEEIFEINKSDLDFGIYRILNIKRKEIENFFRNSLPSIIEKELAPFASAGNAEIRKRLSEIEHQLGGKDTIASMSDSIPLVAEYHKSQSLLASGLDMAGLESDVYSALYSFFNRYYEEGDFISKRRYKEGVYAIPYGGEEVKLYWANQDQYYIKTSENFKDYTFMAEDITVHFRLVDATTEQNNNKESENKKRVFMLFVENQEEYPGINTFSYDPEAKELVIRFTYDIPVDKKKKYADENYKAIVGYIAGQLPELVARLMKNTSTNQKEVKPLIQKHLEAYVAKNTFDYFIHKDLKGFLSRELDFYIKNEILHIDDIDSEDVNHNAVFFAKIRAIKKVARILIDFLAQLENFQKRLWLKKKFVVETNWCITLDNIDESFYPEIASNQAQTEDWINLFAINKIIGKPNAPSFSVPLTIDFLKENKNLVLDTRHFSHSFRDKLVASINNLDDRTSGLLINSDNHHAIRLLNCKYRNKVDCIYIDPPYNSKSSRIAYKNSYLHSSWLSLVNNRIEESKCFLSDNGSLVVAIDENEHVYLTAMLKEQFFGWDITSVSIQHNKKGIQGDHFSYNHEYAVFVIPEMNKKLNRLQRDNSDWEWSSFRNWGDESLRSDAANCFFPIYVYKNKVVGYGMVCDDYFHPTANEHPKGSIQCFDINGEKTILNQEGIIAVYPIDESGVERKWRYAFQSFASIARYLRVVKSKDNIIGIEIPKRDDQFKTLWISTKYNAGDYGTKILTNMGFHKSQFKFPKSIHTTKDCLYAVSSDKSIVFDYFGGSGTTAHSTIELNRKEGHSRKYIIVEMGEYFSTVTKPRIEKAIYSDSWKNGVPTNRTSGVSQIVMYMRLESYEDALSNVLLTQPHSTINFGDEYLINYMLDVESRDSLLNVDKFNEPFDFAMYITERNETKKRKIDVVETFNFLIGLSV